MKKYKFKIGGYDVYVVDRTKHGKAAARAYCLHIAQTSKIVPTKVILGRRVTLFQGNCPPDYESFLKGCTAAEKAKLLKDVPQLATCDCGWRGSVLALLGKDDGTEKKLYCPECRRAYGWTYV